MVSSSLGNKILESKRAAKLTAALGIDLRQCRLLVALFSILSNRMEFMGITFGLNKVVGWYAFFSMIISLSVFVNPSLPGYLLSVIGISMGILFMMLLNDTANSIMNPDEASVLAHQPIRGATYITAKLTRVLVVVFAIVSSLNAIPAIAGVYLRESRWFYPLTHLLAAYLAGLFVAFLICGIYGWLFQFISPSKLKNTALWLQLLAFMLPILLFHTLQIVFRHEFLERILNVSKLLGSAWMPWRWFVALGLMGHTEYARFSAWEMSAALLVTIALIAFGLRGFRADYMIKVSALVQGSAASGRRSSRISWLNPWVRKLAGAPSGFGAFSWVSIMIRRDWNFRTQALMNVGVGLIILLLIIVKGIQISPYTSGAISPIHALPHVLGIFMAVTCRLIAYTAEPKGSSIFATLPLEPLQPFVHGIYLSLWMPAGILHLCLLGPCMWFWGVIPSVLFLSFSLVLSSAYLCMTLFFIDGFPFANAFKPFVGKELSMLFLVMLIPIIPLLIMQWLVFHNKFIILGSTVVLALVAYMAAHFSFGRLKKRIHDNVQTLGFGSQQIFKEVE